jgi:adhesin HecA-like repeat protein
MKKLSKKIALLFGAVLAVCAFAAPMASAASFFQVGTTHQLTSNDLGFSQAIGGGLTTGLSCATTQFDSDVTSAAVLTITGGRLDNCRGTGIAAGCTVTATGTKFPWTATAPTTASIQIHGIHVDVRYETAPGGATPCNALLHNQNVTWTGTLTGGVFDPSAIGTNRRITFVNASGIVSHSALANGAATLFSFSLRDPAGTLNIFD